MADAILADVESSGIYQIRNTINGKRYVGSAKCFRVRWNAHRANLRKGAHHSPHLQSSWEKNGEGAFAFEILELCVPRELLAREQVWIDRLKPAFNVCRVAGNTLGRKCSPETRARIGARLLGAKMPPRTDEYRRAMSAIHAGKRKPPHVVAALQAGRARRVYTDEQRSRVSESLKLAYADGRRTREKSEAHCHRIGQHYAKLTDEQVLEIRALRASGVTGRELAVRYGSNPGTISEICSGKRYRWVA